jgi:hypothetical protein
MSGQFSGRPLDYTGAKKKIGPPSDSKGGPAQSYAAFKSVDQRATGADVLSKQVTELCLGTSREQRGTWLSRLSIGRGPSGGGVNAR